MGFESFGVTMRVGRVESPATAGPRTDVVTAQKAISVIRRLEHVEPDPESEMMPGSTCFLMNDGKHAIEMEVMDAPVMISCRFTLCHPPTVDAVFTALVRKLMDALDLRVKIGDQVPLGKPHEFTLASFDDFVSIASGCIAERRQEWKAAFGQQTLGATTVQVHERIISQHYQHHVEKAG